MPDNSPYKTMAVASTFSPRFRHVLAEAKRLQERFRAELHVIYAGKRSEEAAAQFREALEELQPPADSTIHYEEGDPAEAILRTLDREKIDVIIAGALEKEVVLHPFLGNVARRLVREAPCSVMLFTTPAAKPKPLRRNHVNGFMSFVSSLRLIRRARRFVGIREHVQSRVETMTKKRRWKNLFCQPATPMFRSR